jgi:dipeptidyl aminopeptidase/acylaminoacyl peptidase
LPSTATAAWNPSASLAPFWTIRFPSASSPSSSRNRQDVSRESETTEVFRFKTKAPGATISQPDWAPDSTRIVFSCWDQESEQIALYEALTRPEEQKPRKGEKKKEKGDTEKTRKEDRKDEKDSEKETEEKEDRTDRSDQSDKPKDPENSGDKKDEGKPKPEKARKIYSFMHTGGPNTPEMIEPQYLADSRRIVFLSEITGFRHLQILDPLYEGLSPLTHGYFEVYPLALSKDHKWVFILSTQDHPGRQSLYKVSTDDGTLVRLSPELGYYEEAAVSPQGDYALSNFSTFGKLRELVAINTAQSTQTALTDSHPPIARVHTRVVPEFITYKNRHGHDIHGQMFRPDGWDKNEKWPLLVYVYGGPLGIRKMVTDGAYDQASYFFALYMAKKHGYVTVTIDPRGVSGYGGVFAKATYARVGRPQVEDLVDGVDYLVEHTPWTENAWASTGGVSAASRRRCASTPNRTSSPQVRRAPDPPNGKTTTPGTHATRWATAARANRT